MKVENLRYELLLVPIKKIFLVRFTQINDQISVCEKILEKNRETLESLLSGLGYSSPYLPNSQVEKAKKQIESISRTYNETAEKLKSLLGEREDLQRVVSLYEDIVDIRLLIIEIKHPLLLEEYSALQYKTSQ
jgi:arginine utilization protein RocB